MRLTARQITVGRRDGWPSSEVSDVDRWSCLRFINRLTTVHGDCTVRHLVDRNNSSPTVCGGTDTAGQIVTLVEV